MTNIPEPYYTELKAQAYLQYKTAAGRNQVRPEGIAILMANGTVFPGRSNEQAQITAAEDAIGHLKATFTEVAADGDPTSKHVAAVLLMTKDIPSQDRPTDPTEAGLGYLRTYPGIGSCETIHVIAAHTEVGYDLKL